MCVQIPTTGLTTWWCPPLMLSAGRAAVDQYLRPAWRCGPMLGQTDCRTPYRYTDPAPHTMRAVPIKCAEQDRKALMCSDVCLKHTQTRRVGLHEAAAAAVPYCIINTDCSKFKTHHSQPLCGHYTRVSFYILVKSMDNFIGSQLHCP